jgi:NADH-quinone oxidoreductase subunit C
MDNRQQLKQLLTTVDNIKVNTDSQRRFRLDVPAKELPALLELLKGRAGFLHLSAISCVDWIDEHEFELVYHLWSYQINTLVSAHIRVKRDPGVYISVYDLYQPAAFFERDIHEMYGLYFEGAPDMQKFILTEWDGPPPMRKEFDSEGWVNDHFDWQDYRPDWLIEIEEQGGGIAVYPEEQRFSQKSQD